ncbi:MAG: DNA/RNA nuclease SfsA [Armatimonadetes bacterium]|nr:DNA/RNA nuclease SfsA [Armatimonadota bacterium]
MQTSETAVKARFVERPNRFLVLARLEEGGDVVRVHCADPGRLHELLLPAARLYISPRPPGGSTQYTLERVEHGPERVMVGLRSTLANALFEEALAERRLAPFSDAAAWRREATPPPGAGGGTKTRFDFRLEMPDGTPCWVEVKSATLVEDGIARWPDAVTERGARHALHLAELARDGLRCAVCWVVQRPDAFSLEPNEARDPRFAAAIRTAAASGVECWAWTATLTPTEARLGRPITVRP